MAVGVEQRADDSASTIRETFGARLRRLRVARRLSTRGLALRIGRNHSLVVRWELGTRSPTLFDVAALARPLGTTVDGLVAGLSKGSAPPRTWSSRAHGRRRRRALGRCLRQERLAHGRSVWDVRLATGISGRRLLAIEHGADPSLDEIVSLAALFSMSLDQALRSLDDPEDLHKVRRSTTPLELWQARSVNRYHAPTRVE